LIQIKRAYEPASSKDGTRILVDRLWPRGVSKEKIKVKEWMREIGPSKELIKWFGHDPKKFEEFERRYRKELDDKEDLVEKLRALSKERDLTLVYSAKDQEHNQAVVLKKVLEGK
jgi:uncharacterized protein YeaO (DUF488 family)